MIELHLLGSIVLRQGTRTFPELLRQRKRFALLAYLAANDRELVSRDLLLALFWPEADDWHARAALRNALTFVRRSLGDGVVIRHGDQVGISQTRLCCDVRAFAKATRAGDAEEALRLYRGAFMQGFHLPEAPPFEEWLESTCSSLRSQAARTAREFAAAISDRDPTSARAIDFASRAVELAPEDERSWRMLIAGHAASGNRAAAFAAYGDFERWIRSEFGVEPAPETQELIAAIRCGRQASVLPRPGGPPTTDPESPPDTAAAEVVEAEARRLVPSLALTLLAMLFIAGVLLAGWMSTRTSGTLADGPNSEARELFLRANELAGGTDEAANFAAAELLHQAIRLDSAFGEGYVALARLYVGRSYNMGADRRWADSAEVLLRHAQALEPQVPVAFEELAMVHLDRGRLSEAAEQLQEVLRMQGTSIRSLVGLGWIHLFRGEIAAAVEKWQHARSLDPLDPIVLLDLGAAYAALGDTVEAARWRRAAARANASHPYVMDSQVRFGGDLALRNAEEFRRAYPRLPLAKEALARAALAAGELQRARAHFTDLASTSPDDWNFWGLTYRTDYAYVLLETGDTTAAIEILEATLLDGEALIAAGDERPGIRRELAAATLALGRQEEAFAWMERAVSTGWRLENIHRSAILDRLKGDKRYNQILRVVEKSLEAERRAMRAGATLNGIIEGM